MEPKVKKLVKRAARAARSLDVLLSSVELNVYDAVQGNDRESAGFVAEGAAMEARRVLRQQRKALRKLKRLARETVVEK